MTRPLRVVQQTTSPAFTPAVILTMGEGAGNGIQYGIQLQPGVEVGVRLPGDTTWVPFALTGGTVTEVT